MNTQFQTSKMSFHTSSAQETKELAKTLAKEWMHRPLSRGALVVGFEGELGSGKTTFIQGAVEALGVQENVTSPTFVLMKRYQARGNRNLYHIDCYRLADPKELLSLSWREIIKHQETIVFVEWADRVRSFLPKHTILIRFEHLSEHKRKITIRGCSPRVSNQSNGAA